MASRQLGNTQNTSIPAVAQVLATEDVRTPTVDAPATPDGPAPTRKLNHSQLRILGGKQKALFDRYASDRLPAEQKWLKNLRQYLGVYDPEIDRSLPRNKSRAYPRLTRMKCISMLSRLMNLMFPGNEDNWELRASPSPSMSPDNVRRAVEELMAEIQAEGGQPGDMASLIDVAVRRLADKQASHLTTLIKDQLMELGGDQTIDWIGLNRKICDSGIKYGIGVLEGPYVRRVEESGWVQVEGGGFQPTTKTLFKPQYDFLPVWDFYPDMSARSLPGEGYFKRKVLGRAALRKLGRRPDFFEDVIKQVLVQVPGGNYTPKSWETELKTMGLAMQADSTSNRASGREKYEVIIYHGPISAQTLQECGVVVPDKLLADDVEAELWMVNDFIIKADINAWRKLGVEMRQVHIFSFDEDDTSPISQGLPGIVRDSQLSICAATRMVLDNGSVVCGPNLEVNNALMMPGQDLTQIEAYKIWFRDDEGLTAQFPAVRQIKIDGHINELMGLVKMFLDFAEIETFIGPSTGGDMTKVPGEPMRTAAGASMLRSDAALPFKDIVRNYDTFTQSVIWSLVQFNKKYNPNEAPEGDYDVIPRGATSLIAKEVRGMQIDMLAQTLTPDERDHLDERKFVEARFASRDLEGMLVPEHEAERRKTQRAQQAAEEMEVMRGLQDAERRKTLSDAYKNIAQGQKNIAGADKTAIETATAMMETPDNDDTEGTPGGAGRQAAGRS